MLNTIISFILDALLFILDLIQGITQWGYEVIKNNSLLVISLFLLFIALILAYKHLKK